jgi:predicted transcriptional regulator
MKIINFEIKPVVDIQYEIFTIDEIDNNQLAEDILNNQIRATDNILSSMYEDMVLPSTYETNKFLDLINNIASNKGLKLDLYWTQIHRHLESTDVHYHRVTDRQVRLSWVYYVKTPKNCGKLIFIIENNFFYHIN